MTTADFVLFLHIAFVIAGMSVAGVLHAGLLIMRAARDVAALRAWPRVIAALELALPLSALLILLTGAWLLHLSAGEFAWSQGWVIVSLVGLVCAEIGGALIAPRSVALRQAINRAADGPVSEELRQRILDPVVWSLLHGATADFLAVVFVRAQAHPAAHPERRRDECRRDRQPTEGDRPCPPLPAVRMPGTLSIPVLPCPDPGGPRRWTPSSTAI